MEGSSVKRHAPEERDDAGPLFSQWKSEQEKRWGKVAFREDPPKFDGSTIDPTHDTARLTAQLARVRNVMLGDREWRTLLEIAVLVGAPESSVSARLRDLRKPKFGGWTVERRRRGDPKLGLHEYRVSSGVNK